MIPRIPSTGRGWCRGLGAIALLAVCLQGCGGESGTIAGQQGPFVLRLGAALPEGVRGTGVSAVVSGLYAEGALGVDRSGRVQPRVFQKGEWHDNGLRLRLPLPRGIRFHDGSELTPAIAAEILQRYFASPNTFTFRAVTRVTAGDDFVDVHLSQPEPLLPDDLVEVALTTGPTGTIGTGPFMLEGPPTGEYARLRAFAGYRHGAAKLESVEVKRYPSLRGAWTAMMRGEINMLHEVGADALHFIEAESSVRTYPFVRPYTYFVAFNMRHPVLRRREVRQALSQAIDRPAIIRDAMDGRGEVADGPIWKYHWAFSTAQRAYQYNPEAASLRLDAAGLRRPAAGAAGRMPSRFRFKCLLFADDSRFERIALLLQKQLFDIGVDMEIEPVTFRQLGGRIARGDFDAFVLEMISGRSIGRTYRVWRSGPAGLFDSGYTAADAALDRVRQASTDAELRSAVNEVQRVMYEDPPALFVAWPTTSRAVSADIQVPYEPNFDIYGRLTRFDRTTPEQARR
jgi:peptide/nickel transport system substrate-binding protein